jgi:hypothetical protein
MHHGLRAVGMTLGLATALTLVAPCVEACSRAICPGDAIAPIALPDTPRTIPSNLPGIAWAPGRLMRPVTPDDIRLVRAGDAPSPVATTFAALPDDARILILRPTTPWIEGSRYTLSLTQPCTSLPGAPEPVSTSSFIIGPPQDFPRTLGTLSLGPIEQYSAVVPPDSYNGSCGTDAEIASRTPSLALSADATAWSPYLFVELLVDGQPRGHRRVEGGPIPGRNFYDGPDQLPYVVCSTQGAAVGLSAGVHRFQYRASVIGSDTFVLSNEVRAEIVCSGTQGDGGDAGGCSVSRRRAASGGLWVAALIGLWLGLGRRAVRRRARAM